MSDSPNLNPEPALSTAAAASAHADAMVEAAHAAACRSPAGTHLPWRLEALWKQVRHELRDAPHGERPAVARRWAARFENVAQASAETAETIARAFSQGVELTAKAATIDPLLAISGFAIRGIALCVEHGAIVAAPAGLLTDSDREILKVCRAEIMAALLKSEAF